MTTMGIRHIFATAAIAAAIFTIAACGGSPRIQAGATAVSGTQPATPSTAVATRTATAIPTPTIAPTETPPAIKVLFFLFDPKRLVRFVASIHNPATKAVSGLKVQWNALDSSGAIVFSFTATMPDIPAGGDYLYVGGTGSVLLSGPAASVKLTVVSPGTLVSSPSPMFATSDVTLVKEPFSLGSGSEYGVSATVTSGDSSVPRANFGITTILRDASGNIVGADFTTPDNAPDPIPAATKLRVQDGYIDVTATPATAQVFAFDKPS